MKILFAGSPKPSSEVLEYISKNTPHEVVGVITQPDKRRKRGNLKVESDVSRVAKALAIKTYKPFVAMKCSNLLPLWATQNQRKD